VTDAILSDLDSALRKTARVGRLPYLLHVRVSQQTRDDLRFQARRQNQPLGRIVRDLLISGIERSRLDER
jgi:hypothetical protein